MNIRTNPIACAAVAVCTGLAVQHANAGRIIGLDNVDGPGLGSAFLVAFDQMGTPTFMVNNDNADRFVNKVNLQKVFDHVGHIDMVFQVINSAGDGGVGSTTEYFLDENVINSTPEKWIDYHFQLGFGIGDEFVPSNINDFLDFDTPDRDPTPTSDKFQNLIHQANDLWWSNGSVQPGESVNFMVPLDIPDQSDEIPESAHRMYLDPFFGGQRPGYVFTLRQFPTVIPTPGALVLLGVGALAVRRRRGT